MRARVGEWLNCFAIAQHLGTSEHHFLLPMLGGVGSELPHWIVVGGSYSPCQGSNADALQSRAVPSFGSYSP